MLKWIALLLMIVDHVAYTFNEYIPSELYWTMRALGRISFPIFVYYCVLGLQRTSNLKLYMKRLLMFAIMAELAKRAFPFYQDPYLNVIFSLFLYGLFYVLLTGALGKLQKEITYAIVVFLLFAVVPFVEYGYSGLMVFVAIYYINKVNSAYKNSIAALAITLSFLPEMIIYPGLITYIRVFAGISGLLMFNALLDRRLFSKRVEKWTFYYVYPIQWIVLGVIYLIIK